MAYTAIDNPEAYFQVKTYTGTGSSQAFTLDGDEDMQPDFVWIKNRGATGHHMIFDAVRTAGDLLYSNLTSAELAAGSNGHLESFDSDGFTLGDNSGVGSSNGSTETYVAWCWKMANGTASNSNGTNITSTVSANTTAGQSIVSYSGSGTTSDTVGHGLSSLDLLIVKSRDETDSWFVKHKDLASSKNLNLDQTVAETDVTSAYSEGGLSNLSGNTFGFLDGTSDANAVNESSEAHIAYCFKGVQGYSKFGSYTGNGDADGTFIYTGFKPRWFMCKAHNAAEGWNIWDSKRSSTGNSLNEIITVQSNNAEFTATDWDIDFVSNGIKMRDADGGFNYSGYSYIYMAFAEAPFVNSNGVPCNAR